MGLVKPVIQHLEKLEHRLEKCEESIRKTQSETSNKASRVSNKASRVRWLKFSDIITGTGLQIHIEHIDGKQNVLADSLSRLVNLCFAGCTEQVQAKEVVMKSLQIMEELLRNLFPSTLKSPALILWLDEYIHTSHGAERYTTTSDVLHIFFKPPYISHVIKFHKGKVVARFVFLLPHVDVCDVAIAVEALLNLQFRGAISHSRHKVGVCMGMTNARSRSLPVPDLCPASVTASPVHVLTTIAPLHPLRMEQGGETNKEPKLQRKGNQQEKKQQSAKRDGNPYKSEISLYLLNYNDMPDHQDTGYPS
ncbi:hypothetical protein LXL04_023672 [Taraxacum kok-saghyz]